MNFSLTVVADLTEQIQRMMNGNYFVARFEGYDGSSNMTRYTLMCVNVDGLFPDVVFDFSIGNFDYYKRAMLFAYNFGKSFPRSEHTFADLVYMYNSLNRSYDPFAQFEKEYRRRMFKHNKVDFQDNIVPFVFNSSYNYHVMVANSSLRIRKLE